MQWLEGSLKVWSTVADWVTECVGFSVPLCRSFWRRGCRLKELLIKNFIAHKAIDISSSLQAIAVRATLFKSIIICSLYLPPSSKWTKSDIDDIIAQLPPPILLLFTDFNAHSKDWDCPSDNRKGKIIGDLLMECDLSVLNDGSTTYLHAGSGSQSAIDLSICDPSLYLDLFWQVHHDLCGSNHFPIAIYCNRASTFETNSSWKLSKANWKAFSDKAASDLKYESVQDPDDPATNLNLYFPNVI